MSTATMTASPGRTDGLVRVARLLKLVSQGHALEVLAILDEGDASTDQLATLVGVEPRALWGPLHRLREAGLIRTDSGVPRWCAFANAITPEGRRLVEAARVLIR